MSETSSNIGWLMPLCQFFQDYEKFSLPVILSNPKNSVNPDSKPGVEPH